MNRNESFLVYGMFGLLALIVMVALLFGGEPANANQNGGEKKKDVTELAQNDADPRGGSTMRDLSELPGLNAEGGLGPVDDELQSADALTGGARGPGAPGAGSAGTGPAAAGVNPGDAASRRGNPGPGSRDVSALGAGNDAGNTGNGAGGSADPKLAGGAPSGAEGGLGSLKAGATTTPRRPTVLSRPAPRQSTRVGDYRRVTVQPGDTFSTLVVRWCGSLDSMDLAAALNETVDRDNLTSGTTLLLPWVDDETLAARQRDRNANRVLRDVAEGNTYTVRDGDSLWAIARLQVESNAEVPGYIEKIEKLNPGIVSDRLMVGQKIVMP